MPITEYKCELCNFNCGSKKSSYIKHLQSRKHLKRLDGDDGSVTSEMTETTEYQSHNDLALLTAPQSKPQTPTPSSPIIPTTNNDFQLNMILQEINFLKSQNLIYQNEISNLKSQVSLLETKIFILNNNEIQAIKTTQQIQNMTQSQNIQQIQTVAVSNTKSVSKKQTNKQPDNISTEPKETPSPPAKQTLTEYLNTECRNAGEFDDFCKENKEIDINKFVNETHVKEPPNAEVTLSSYVMTYLKHLPLEKIPFRCIDIQNKKVVIKIKGKWYLASEEHRDSFIEYARSRLNEHYSNICVNHFEKDDEQIQKINNEIKLYEENKSLAKRTQAGEDRKKVEAEFENFDYRATNQIVERKIDDQCIIMNRAIKFPETKQSFINTLLHEVLKYCKIDTRNLEVEELPMYYPDVIPITPEPEPQHIVLAIKEQCPQENNNPSCPQENNNPAYLCSLLIYRAYKRYVTEVSQCPMSEDNLKIFIKVRIITAFGFDERKDMNKYFEAQMTKQELLTTMELFKTTTSIRDILLNENMEYEDKLIFMAEKIEQLTKENIQVQ